VDGNDLMVTDFGNDGNFINFQLFSDLAVSSDLERLSRSFHFFLSENKCLIDRGDLTFEGNFRRRVSGPCPWGLSPQILMNKLFQTRDQDDN